MFWDKKEKSNFEQGDLVKIDLKPVTRHQAEWYKSAFGNINGELGLIVGKEVDASPIGNRYKVYLFNKKVVQSFLSFQLSKQQ